MLLMMRVALVDVSFKGVDDGCRCVGVFKRKDVMSASACTFNCASIGGTGALVRDTAASLLQGSVCMVVIGDCEYEDSTCSRYSAENMPASSVQ
eukprot:3862874-Ditylum_brightwellii.AAC.1